MIPIVLVVDYGTSNVRVCGIELEQGGNVVSKSVKYKPVTTAPGCYEMAPEQMWEETQLCMENTLEGLDLSKYQIEGISFSFFGDSFVPVDKDGTPTHNLFLCFDPRGVEEANEVTAKVGADRILKLIGDFYESGCTGAKILYFKKHFPEAYEKTEKFYTIQQYILRKTGMPDVNEVTVGCGKSLMDNEKREWSPELLDAVGITKEQLGEIVEPTSVIGEIDKFGRVTLPYPIKVFPGIHDSDGGYVGLGINEESNSCVAEVAGTFDHIGMIVHGHVNSHAMHPEEDCWSRPGPLPYSSSVLSAFAASGAMMEWFMTQIVGDTSQDSYRDLWSNVVFDGSDGIEFTPGFTRSAGTMSGLSIATTKYDIFRGVVEMLTFETRRCIELCEKLNPNGIETIRIGGGGAREEKWVQLRADITGKTYQIMKELESSALGAAMIAGVGLGVYKNAAEAAEHMVSVKKTLKPNTEIQRKYEAKYKAYLKKNYS